MTITQIKWFLAVARTLNFTKAADQLGVSQPTLSRQIVNMEEELNLQLFIRSGHRFEGLQIIASAYNEELASIGRGRYGPIQFFKVSTFVHDTGIHYGFPGIHEERIQRGKYLHSLAVRGNRKL